MESKYERLSELKLEISQKDGMSVLSDVYFTPPFKIMKPFYERDMMKILQMSASPGLMEGDIQQISINIKANASAEMYSQSYEKIHKMENGKAIRNIDINIGSNAMLIYNPLPVIPYAKSAFENKINIRLLNNTSRLMLSEILSSGRVVRGELFKYTYYNSLVEIYEENKITYRDNCRYNPNEYNMSSIGMYEGYTHILNIVLCNIDASNVEDIFSDYDKPWGVTKNEKGYTIIRAFGLKAQELEEKNNLVRSIIAKETLI